MFCYVDGYVNEYCCWSGNGAPSAGAATSSVHIGGGPPTSKVTVKTEQKVSIKQEPGVKDESMDVVGGDGACEPDEECTRDRCVA